MTTQSAGSARSIRTSVSKLPLVMYFLIFSGVVLSLQPVVAATVILAAAADSVPTSYVENGKQTGILIDVINEAFRRAGYSVQVKLMPWARCLKAVKTGDVDGIFSVFVTPERQMYLTYTNEVLITQVQAFFVRSDSSLTFEGDLSKFTGQSIGVVNQTSYGPRLDAALKGGIFEKIDSTKDSESNIRKLIAGRVDMIPSYRHVVLSTAKKLGALDKIRQLSPDIESIPSYLAFTQKRDFAKLISDYDKAIASMKEDGTYDQLFNRYIQ
jgi:polar amino acid transport system substrate-binding protein